MNCPRCRHWIPDGANFCQTCGHQFAIQIVKAKRSRLAAVFLGLLMVFALIGVFFVVRQFQSAQNGEGITNRGESVAVHSSPLPTATPTPFQDPFTTVPDRSTAEVDSRPIPLNRPQPNYTDAARNNNVQGVIRANALIGTDGLVKDVKLVSHLPDGLDDEARLAVQQMRFRPATKSGQPVSFWQMLEVEFNLSSGPGQRSNEVTTASGLKYVDEVVGDGRSPSPGTMVTVHYTGTMENGGAKFDSSYDHPGAQPYQFRIGTGTVIKGWDEGVMTMREGGKRKLIIPADLAYGSQGRPGIPAYSILVFEVELLKVSAATPQ